MQVTSQFELTYGDLVTDKESVSPGFHLEKDDSVLLDGSGVTDYQRII